jgi:hypothetical protein
MNAVPIYLHLSFLLITVATIALFWWVTRKRFHKKKAPYSRIFLVGSLLWLGLQGLLSVQGIYTDSLDALPPRIAVFGMIPALLFVVSMLILPSGKRFVDSLPLREMTLLHTIRIPVELVLYGLFIAGTIPEVMTFAGRNFDILAGITAPIIMYLAFRPTFRKRLLVIWNVVCLALLLNVVVYALLSAPFPWQQLAFDQPNVAVLHFPFVWLPTYVVPLVIFCHLAALRQLLQR